MRQDIFFLDDVTDRLDALYFANAQAMAWARQFGASARDVAIVEAAYQAALLDVGVSFGLHRSRLSVVLQGGEVDGGVIDAR